MAARILMVVAVLIALYGCGQSPETKDSFEGVEPLGPEASAFSTVALTGQNVELESDVVEQADRDSRRPAYVYLECGYGGGLLPNAVGHGVGLNLGVGLKIRPAV